LLGAAGLVSTETVGQNNGWRWHLLRQVQIRVELNGALICS
jgi:hypothetical protein